MAHHAYLIVGPWESAQRTAYTLHDLTPQEAEGNPDLQIFVHDVFGIAEVRMLHQYAYQRPILRPYRVFIIRTQSVTHEAQNALLKLFEDPPSTSSFVLSIDRDDRILPTLRSRFDVIQLSSLQSISAGRDFLALSYAVRLEEIAKRHKAKDTVWYGALISSLEEIFHAKMDAAVLKDLSVVSKHFLARGASVKMLLEHLSLSLDYISKPTLPETKR